MEHNVLQVKVEAVGFDTASEKIKELTENIRLFGIAAKHAGLKKRDIRKLIKLAKEKKDGKVHGM